MSFKKDQYRKVEKCLRDMSENFGAPVNSVKCEDRLQKIISAQVPDCFLTLVNIKNQELIWSYGVNKYLGYKDQYRGESNEFTFYNSIDIVHEERRNQYLTFGFAAYEIFQLNKQLMNSFQQQYMIKIPVRKRNGKYLWVKQTCMPFELDRNNNLISQINFYFIIGKYKGQPLEKPTIFGMPEEKGRRKDWEQLVTEKAKLIFFPFTGSEEKLLGFYAFCHDKTIAAASEQLNWSKDWVKGLNKSILDKGRRYYSKEFKTATNIADYLKRLGWIKSL